MPPLLSSLVLNLCPRCLGSCLGPVDSPSCCVPWLPSFAPHRRPSLAFDRRYQKKHAVLARDITSPIRSPRHQASTHHILFLHIACPGPAVGPSLGKCYFLVRSSYIFPDGLLSPPPRPIIREHRASLYPCTLSHALASLPLPPPAEPCFLADDHHLDRKSRCTPLNRPHLPRAQPCSTDSSEGSTFATRPHCIAAGVCRHRLSIDIQYSAQRPPRA
jgi:hypothetical protein